MSGRFSEKNCIVTGAASGIGRACSEAFLAEGANVVCADINYEGASATAKSGGDKAAAFELDVTREEGWAACLQYASGKFGAVDVLVNCAGLGRSGDFEEFALSDWNDLLAVNLTGTYLGCQAAMRVMRPQGSGVVVNISSIAAQSGGADIAAYCATKGGVTSLTKAVSMHGAPHGVRCCAVSPTYVDSEMLDPAVEHFPSRQAMLDLMAELVPTGRVATPEDVANAILMVASDDAAMITGSTLFVDGGQMSGMPSRHTE